MKEKANIGTLFDRIAKRYDLLNHLLSLNIDKRWRRKAVQQLVSSSSEFPTRLLDVAIGTGDLTIEILRQKKADLITGIDLSEEMMRIGQEKANKAGIAKQVQFLKASALEMPFDDNTFDAVTCAYGVRNFSDLNKGLLEMCRVLQPNGQLLILEFSHPSNRFFAWMYDLYFSHILPFVGRLISGDKTAYTYLNRSVKDFVETEELCARLSQVGFTDIHSIPLTHGISTIYTARKLV